MESILVTGGAGFIGSHTCLSLLKKGYCLYIIDSFINSSKLSIPRVLNILENDNINRNNNINLVTGDVTNKSVIRDLFKIFKG